ncbi:hypothetical protein [Ensifer sp. SSB1]|uniref:hypothetical protein n=1 Tax=Ensifer sp. SSB1 TaxID=2795385 RepID=UPI001A562E79|nr:hypothetical protein [Ensifer sp. SSB1]MBK5567415.1 hypothetical protein [Ensifer sp. SSB1]
MEAAAFVRQCLHSRAKAKVVAASGFVTNRRLDRVRGVPYPQLVRKTTDLMAHSPLAGASQLVVDATGVSDPVLDMLRSADLQPVAVTGSLYRPVSFDVAALDAAMSVKDGHVGADINRPFLPLVTHAKFNTACVASNPPARSPNHSISTTIATAPLKRNGGRSIWMLIEQDVRILERRY